MGGDKSFSSASAAADPEDVPGSGCLGGHVAPKLFGEKGRAEGEGLCCDLVLQ